MWGAMVNFTRRRGEVRILPTHMWWRRGETMCRMIVRIVIGIWGVVVEIWITPWRGLWRVVGIVVRIPVGRGPIVWRMIVET
jgi:hypothetical protein